MQLCKGRIQERAVPKSIEEQCKCQEVPKILEQRSVQGHLLHRAHHTISAEPSRELKRPLIHWAVMSFNVLTFVRYQSAEVANGPSNPNRNRTAYVISAQHTAHQCPLTSAILTNVCSHIPVMHGEETWMQCLAQAALPQATALFMANPAYLCWSEMHAQRLHVHRLHHHSILYHSITYLTPLHPM